MCGGGTLPKQGYKHMAEGFRGTSPMSSLISKSFMYGYNKMPDQNESTPPVQRSAPSSSGGPTSLGIRRRSSSARKRSVSSGRRTSKSKRFSTTR